MTDEQVWKIIGKMYGGSVDPPSLLAQKIFDISVAIRDQVSSEHYDLYDGLLRERYMRTAVLEDEIRELKGLPPLPPIPMASNEPIMFHEARIKKGSGDGV